MEMRSATQRDKPQAKGLVEARSTWQEARGLESWRPALDHMVAQCDNPDGGVWVLLDDAVGMVGQMPVQDVGPPWGWKDAERAEPALYLSGSITLPNMPGRLGETMALWAVDRAARLGIPWVRRHCQVKEVAEYNLTQGFALVREEQRTSAHLWMMAR